MSFSQMRSCLLLFVALVGVSMAQRVEGESSITGRILDSRQGRPLPQALVRLESQDSGRQWEVESDSSGHFLLPALAPGDYLLTVALKGFFSVSYEVRLGLRQALTLPVEVIPNEGLDQEVVVYGTYSDLNPDRTGSSRLFGRRELEELPSSVISSTTSLATHNVPGAVVGHDNFLHFRGNELSMHQFINGVSFLDNTHQHFSAGLSPRIFRSVEFIAGGFMPEYGNRFGGVLDISTRSGRDLQGHGSLSVGVGTQLNHDTAFEYGGEHEGLGYYFFVSGFQSGRFLNPPTPREIHDLGKGGRFAAQLDYQGTRDSLTFLLMGGGSNFELPNTVEEADQGRDAFRRIRSQTAMLNWRHAFSARTLLATSFYQRSVSDRLLGTTDPVTPFGEGSRSTLTVGAKTDLTWNRGIHSLKMGVDVSLLRLRESFEFDPREDAAEAPGEPALGNRFGPDLRDTRPDPSRTDALFSSGTIEAFAFSGRDRGGQVSVYIQDRLTLGNLTLTGGLRWDQLNIVISEGRMSPRVGIAYHFPRHRSVFYFDYNRLFVPPPLEWTVTASELGRREAQEELEEGNPTLLGATRPYLQDFIEAGWRKQLSDRLFFSLAGYHHRGDNSFENSEISNTRLFLPTNFKRAEAKGIEATLKLVAAGAIGFHGHISYAAARVHFFGPPSGGFPGEELEDGERILPAFDQTHTGNAGLFYRSKWRGLWAGIELLYGSGTPVEQDIEVAGEEVEVVRRLDQHLTADLLAGLTLWKTDRGRVDFEVGLRHLGDDAYSIAKESEATPIQFAPRRSLQGRLTFHF